MTNLLQLAQATVTYSNLVVQLMMGEAQKASADLQLLEPASAEFAKSAHAEVIGRDINPTGNIITPTHEFHFVRGVLTLVRRRGLDEKLDLNDPILAHYTNHTIALSSEAAKARTLQFLTKEGFDTAAMEKFYMPGVSEETLSSYPKPNIRIQQFPSEIVSAGELVSVQKAKVTVDFKRKTDTPRFYPGEIQCEFFATTGELRELRMLGREQLEKLGLCKVTRLDVEQGSEEIGPAFSSFTKIVEPEQVRELDSVFRSAWLELSKNLAGRKANCILFTENLGQGETLARFVQELSPSTTSVGFSIPWQNDLPFSAEKTAHASRGRRGFQLVAVLGASKVELKQEVPKSFDASKNYLIFNLQSSTNMSARLAELENSTEGYIHVARNLHPVFGGAAATVYLNGKKQTDTTSLLALSGIFPLEPLTGSAAVNHRAGQAVSLKFDHALDSLAQQFQGNPLSRIFNECGPEMVEALLAADRVEVYRIKANTLRETSVAGRPSLDGHEIVATSYLDKDVATQVASAALDERNRAEPLGDCLTGATVGFRVFFGKKSTGLLFSPSCNAIDFVFLNSDGEIVRRGHLNAAAVGQQLIAIAMASLPRDAWPDGFSK
ncbi:MAG: hypothetical protein JWN25_816 [Verrucomicrobiales bacterium]|nr:hypothetical protein [Verrucomicrobiales bacterium]